jgi:hypothetical protein
LNLSSAIQQRAGNALLFSIGSRTMARGQVEKPLLMVLPPACDGCVKHRKRVLPTTALQDIAQQCPERVLVTFERYRCSVPASFANRSVSLGVYPERLFIVAEGQTVCTHARNIDRSHRKPGKVICYGHHFLALAIVLGPIVDNGSFQRKLGHYAPLGSMFRMHLLGNGCTPGAFVYYAL